MLCAHSTEPLCASSQRVNVSDVVTQLIELTQFVTRRSRKFMWESPRLALPNDYSLVPGKPDHATALAFVVDDLKF
jgi:hypothetical protein